MPSVRTGPRLLARSCVAVIAIAFLSAFAMPTAFPRKGSDAPLSYTFADARPKEQRKSGTESRLITSCDYGSVRLGDGEFTPGLAVLLNDALMARLSGPLEGRKVTLVNFTVHFNDVQFRRGATAQFAANHSPLAGAVDALANDRTVLGCAPDDLRGGYVASELPAGFDTPWVLVVDVEVDGHRFHARHVAPADPRINKVYADSWAETKVMWQAAREADLGPALDALFEKLTGQIAAVHGADVSAQRDAGIPDAASGPADRPD